MVGGATEPLVGLVVAVFDHVECAMVLSGPGVDLVKLWRPTMPTKESFAAEPKATQRPESSVAVAGPA